VIPEWDAVVTEVWEDGAARLSREGAPEMLAEFSMRQCNVTVEAGDVLVVTAGKVTRRDLGRWTQSELDEIRCRAHGF
jgi:hypothetical protein